MGKYKIASENRIYYLSLANFGLLATVFAIIAAQVCLPKVTDFRLASCDINHFLLTPVTILSFVVAIFLLILLFNRWSEFAGRKKRISVILSAIVIFHFAIQFAIFCLVAFKK